MTGAEGQVGRSDDLAVWLLALGQTIAYGALYYIFSALIVSIEADTGWSKAALALGPTLALGLAAVTAPLAGRAVDRGLGAEMLTAAPILGAAGLGAIAVSGGQAGWLAGWAVVGVAQGIGLYDVCFAFLVRRLGAGARTAIIRITLVAGFASSVTYPTAAWAGEAFGWRTAVWAFAAILVIFGTAANRVAVQRLRRGARAGARAYPDAPGALGRAMRRRAFWVLGAVFMFVYLAHAMLITFVIPLFQDRGASHVFAVTAASLIGPSQVGGRFVYMTAGARLGMDRTTGLVLGGMVCGLVALAAAGSVVLLILVVAAVQGAAIGVVSILRPMLIAETLGQEGFGAISGVLAVAPLTGFAIAPYVGALILDGPGAGTMIAVMLALVLAALGLSRLLRAA